MHRDGGRGATRRFVIDKVDAADRIVLLQPRVTMVQARRVREVQINVLLVAGDYAFANFADALVHAHFVLGFRDAFTKTV